MAPVNNGFKITSDHKSFTDKQNSLFDQLDNAAKNNKLTLEPEIAMDVEEKQSKKMQKSQTRHFKSRESIFKRPDAPISKCLPHRRTPHFRKNPGKWTKYSLQDVDEMSDRSNTKAALSFLKELEERNSGNNKEDEKLESLPDKIVFKKSAIAKKQEVSGNVCEDKATFRSSKLVMPEYVVGQKPKKEKKKRVEGESSKTQLKLGHLFEEDSNEDDN